MRQALADLDRRGRRVFFESVPSGGDAYVLKHIVHD